MAFFPHFGHTRSVTRLTALLAQSNTLAVLVLVFALARRAPMSVGVGDNPGDAGRALETTSSLSGSLPNVPAPCAWACVS